MNRDVTVVLNGYKRPWLREIHEAVKNQTIKPKEVMLWYNYPGEDALVDKVTAAKCRTAMCTSNFGVWARFAFALNAKTKYVCVFDDDTVPGTRWLQNCLNTIQTHPGLLGTRGLVFTTNETYYGPNGRYGWAASDVPAVMNEQPVEVDLVGHSWFFEREWLSSFWRELPAPEYMFCGEDMHFSYTLQKYKGLKTYVPPHPKDDKTLWGSLKGEIYGGGMVSLWQGNPQIQINKDTIKDNHTLMNEYYLWLVHHGWKLLYERSKQRD